MNEAGNICKEVRGRFSALLENDLSGETLRETEAHLSGCDACRGALERFRRTFAALGDLPRAEPPPDLPRRIEAAIDRLGRPAASRTRTLFIRHAVAALLVAGIIVGVIRVVPETGGPVPKESLQEKDMAASLPMNQRAKEETAAALQKESRQKREMTDQDFFRAKKADEKNVPAGSMLAAGRASRTEREAPRALLLSCRGDSAWVAAIRDLALARPGDLAAAWGTLSADDQARVTAAWRGAASPPDLRRDLDRALEGAPKGREKRLIETLREAAPETAR